MTKLLLQLLSKVLNATASVLSPWVDTDKYKPIPLCWLYGKHGIEAPQFVGHVKAPTVTTGSASNISFDNFDMGGEITDAGGENCSERGFAYVQGSGGTPTTADSTSSETGSFGNGTFTLNISGLSSNTTYSVRAYAINSDGTGYGTTVEVTTANNTPPNAPTLSSPADTATGISSTPTLEFSATDTESDDITYQVQIDTVNTFDSGSTLDKTSDVDTGFANETTPADTDPFNSGDTISYTVQSADELTAGTQYYWRVRGKDPSGTNTYGDWSSTRSFTTNAPPTVTLNSVS